MTQRLFIIGFLFIGIHLMASSPIAEVRGNLVDIMLAKENAAVFSQNKTFQFSESLPKMLRGKKFTTGLIENSGISQVKCNKSCEIIIALPYKKNDIPGWTFSGEQFSVGSKRNYYIYVYKYNNPDIWLDIPQKQKTSDAPILLFADEIVWTNPIKVPGTVIAQTPEIKKVNLTNPTIALLPDGNYLAAIANAIREPGDPPSTSFFLSTDKGKSWSVQSTGDIFVNYGNLFVHNGNVYIMGCAGVKTDVVICKSTDQGKTWTHPTGENSGILLKGSYHTAPVPVVIHNDRIWRAMERSFVEKERKAFVMSAPVDADLLKASSWISSEALDYRPDWISGNNFKQWIEGNVVVDRNGEIVNILRVDDEKNGQSAAIISIRELTKSSFNPEQDIIFFPGGGKKFTIRYDSKSDRYWTISNAVFDTDRTTRHAGIYKNGIHCGLIRNHLVLMYSDNLRNWTVKDTLISSRYPFFHGFQYIDWQFEGNDIIAVSRTAFEESRGLPVRQHDANFFLFHRFGNFRNQKIETIVVEDSYEL